ncbi:dihydrodipicolinate synthase family protein [Pararoseomonas indoligenes]|uniref:Dihydrodipicolinate synthase family protein n=1 Tax=Roseomonas indoligenes TaxID=2820811 RepID=A0A940MW63_9PROT|nr:dihydrodipicolinate synthase family protein [Pararoseomonas indoligenes]MBP0495333.1 dihydrodipicolinate synthase family protein [Pararoseomonas indoligenes]
MDLTGIGGIWPASLTPFDRDGAIDEAALRAHLRQLAGTPGVRALVVNGHAGETGSLDRSERKRVVQIAHEVAGEATGVVAGIVTEDPRAACDLARDAREAGADAILLFPPLLFAGGAEVRPDMVLRFFHAVAEAAALPIIVFQLSRPAGLGYAPDLLARLLREVPSIIAVKEGSDVVSSYEDNLLVLAGCGRKVSMLTSNNSWLLASLALGGDGILSGIGSVASGILAEMHEAIARGDLAAARRANGRLRPLVRVFYRRPALDMHNRMKTALNLMGLMPNPAPRAPLLPIEAGEREEIRRALVAAGLLPAAEMAA